ncbi:unnamed protein product [Tetraodon nigroviridis]|uniref:(spotted green pufferfish) hypothetical protein n=1 Tax=Tetraodon nigroviridis TaxID=99883 RepID=Q4SQC8_TETNG|nr:unnamed protein product [Tetraodon nigroviridis]
MGLRHLIFLPLALLVLQTFSFELQDTIHTLIEENIHLHDQLENLTQALRELKRMLWHNSNGTLSFALPQIKLLNVLLFTFMSSDSKLFHCYNFEIRWAVKRKKN